MKSLNALRLDTRVKPSPTKPLSSVEQKRFHTSLGNYFSSAKSNKDFVGESSICVSGERTFKGFVLLKNCFLSISSRLDAIWKLLNLSWRFDRTLIFLGRGLSKRYYVPTCFLINLPYR